MSSIIIHLLHLVILLQTIIALPSSSDGFDELRDLLDKDDSTSEPSKQDNIIYLSSEGEEPSDISQATSSSIFQSSVSTPVAAPGSLQWYERIVFPNQVTIPLTAEVAMMKKELVEVMRVPEEHVDQCIIDGYHSGNIKDPALFKKICYNQYLIVQSKSRKKEQGEGSNQPKRRKRARGNRLKSSAHGQHTKGDDD